VPPPAGPHRERHHRHARKRPVVVRRGRSKARRVPVRRWPHRARPRTDPTVPFPRQTDVSKCEFALSLGILTGFGLFSA
jgi:hypothetical protein